MPATTARTVRFRRIGNSVGATFPKDLLERYGIREKTEVHLVETPDGLLLSTYDEHFSEVVKAYREVEDQYRNTFRELAK